MNLRRRRPPRRKGRSPEGIASFVGGLFMALLVTAAYVVLTLFLLAVAPFEYRARLLISLVLLYFAVGALLALSRAARRRR